MSPAARNVLRHRRYARQMRRRLDQHNTDRARAWLAQMRENLRRQEGA